MPPTVGSTRRKTPTASTIRGLITPRLEGHAMTKLPMTKLRDDRTSRLIVSAAAGVLVFGLVVLFAILVADVDIDDDSDGRSRRCPGYAVGTVDPVTCLPYGSGGAAHAGTNHSGSGSSTARKPAAPPKAPAAKAPAAPPRVSLSKR
ncbi:hypothetical protein ACFWBB_31095 [Streptomyces sp. NPDC060000]|uniref:hypothetical protein n=1 Tax=Streptomyces sp. NPDC060000 TaxID=3347031 RepID=UPI0036947319